MAVETHAIPGARFMDPTVLSRIGNLELVARAVVDGFINGLHKAPYFGASVDFAEHRGYVPGDDIRRMDWRGGGGGGPPHSTEAEDEREKKFSFLASVVEATGYADPRPPHPPSPQNPSPP